MAWSWVRVKTGSSPSIQECLDGDTSAGKFEECVIGLVAERQNRVDDVKFEPNGKWARVLIRWDDPEHRRAILIDLEADEEYEVLSAEEMDQLRASLG
jgi:hypothetical protein